MSCLLGRVSREVCRISVCVRVRRGVCEWLCGGVVVGVSDGVLVGEYHVGLFIDFTAVGRAVVGWDWCVLVILILEGGLMSSIIAA
jgi:hypothetical protein